MTGNKNKAAGADDEFGAADFDFSTMGGDFGGGADRDRDAGEPDFADFGDDPAGAPAFDDASFGGGAKDSSETDFADFGEGAYDDGGFEEMPSPGANPDTSAPGDPDDEFADVASSFDPDEEPSQSGYAASEGFGTDGSFDEGFEGAAAGDDAFATGEGPEGGDPFAPEAGAAAAGAAGAAAAAVGAGRSAWDAVVDIGDAREEAATTGDDLDRFERFLTGDRA